ncbi:MAG: cell shape determination protein CcmA [Flammeovirgaceae bacterium]|nr:cell shape determination protein CcmA [Flammeovirgaceae bacterium]|tara:strand:+ start:5838 stop:6305 length:468 start_codon:yes stop_codon:yes gene_type:complete
MWNKNNQKDMEDLSNSSNIISKGSNLTGNLKAHGNIRIEGKVVGDITTRSKLALGSSSLIKGNVVAQNAEFAGTIIGNVQVTEKLVLKSSSIIKGDLSVNILILESGAEFNGKCRMGVKFNEIVIHEDSDNKNLERKGKKENIEEIGPFLKKAES